MQWSSFIYILIAASMLNCLRSLHIVFHRGWVKWPAPLLNGIPKALTVPGTLFTRFFFSPRAYHMQGKCSAAELYIPAHFQTFYFLIFFLFSDVLKEAIFTGVKCYIIVILIWLSVIISGNEHDFLFLLTASMFSLGKCQLLSSLSDGVIYILFFSFVNRCLAY